MRPSPSSVCGLKVLVYARTGEQRGDVDAERPDADAQKLQPPLPLPGILRPLTLVAYSLLHY